MKNCFLALLFLFSFQQSHAQLEVTTNPVALLFELIPLSIDKPLNQDFSVGLDLLAAPGLDGFVYFAKGRYYFNPKFGADRFNIGMFIGGISEGFGVGFMGGYKVLSAKGVILDFGVGIGRGVNIPLIPYGQLHVGYRFGKKSLIRE